MKVESLVGRMESITSTHTIFYPHEWKLIIRKLFGEKKLYVFDNICQDYGDWVRFFFFLSLPVFIPKQHFFFVVSSVWKIVTCLNNRDIMVICNGVLSLSSVGDLQPWEDSFAMVDLWKLLFDLSITIGSNLLISCLQLYPALSVFSSYPSPCAWCDRNIKVPVYDI